MIFSKSKTYFLLKLAAYLCIFITEKDFSLLKSWKQLLAGTCHDWVDLCVNQAKSRLLIRWRGVVLQKKLSPDLRAPEVGICALRPSSSTPGQ